MDRGSEKKYAALGILIAICCFFGCQSEPQTVSLEKEGKQYGVTQGAFRHRWWNYYERGMSFSDGGFLQEAEKDFREALSQADKDERRARTYGMHFTDYFPHRELGVVLFQQQRYSDAVRELEISLSSEKSARAEYYLDKSRKALIEKEDSDKSPPDISIKFPGDGEISNLSAITVSGIVSDDTFVKEIRINDNPVRIDLSCPRIDFSMEIPILPGKNAITITAKDLSGKIARLERIVISDRTGPVLNIDEASFVSTNQGFLKGYAYDDAKIGQITINGQKILEHPVSDIGLNQTFAIPSPSEKVVVIAEDTIGNRTVAELSLSHHQASDDDDISDRILLASLSGDFPIRLAQNDSDTRGRVIQINQKNFNQLGNYYALIMGINEYQDWPKLKTAVNDAAALKELLIGKYNFSEKNVILKTDKDLTLANLNKELMRITTSLNETDNLLIFFAGHGQISKEANDGYWIPVDGKLNESWTWLTHSSISNLISSEAVKGKNIVIISDACYSGNLIRGVPSDMGANYQQKLLEKAFRRSRQIISSGGIEPVTDAGKDNHSLFAYYLLKALGENKEDLVDLETLIVTQVWKPVSERSNQTPSIGRIRTVMDEDGRFVLALKSGKFDMPAQGQPAVAAAKTSPQETALPSRALSSPEKIAPPVIKLRGRAEKPSYETYQSRVYIEGNASSEAEIREITINNQKVIRKPGKSVYFNHAMELREGMNRFVVKTTDKFDQSAEKELSVTRKVQKVYKIGSRMSVALPPFDISGNQPVNLKDRVGMYLSNAQRFDMKAWLQKQAPLPNESSEKDQALIRMAKGINADFLIAGAVDAKESSLQMTMRVIEVETAQILAYEDAYTEDSDTETINALCEGLAVKICDDFPMIEGAVAAVKDQDVIINIGEKSGIRKGTHLIFFQKGEQVVDPVSKEVLIEAETQEIAPARIQKMLDKASYAELFDKQSLAKLKPGIQFITK